MFSALIRRSPAVMLAVACLVIFGAISYVGLPRESAPDVKIPVVMVTTVYTGVAPADVESLITIPLENELAGVKDLKKMTSSSSEGVAIVSLEFEPEVIIEEALQLVRDRVNKAKPSLPEDADEPTVREISFSDVPIMLVTIAGPVDETVLKALGENLQDNVKRVPGVLDATLSGGREREIRVEVDPPRLAHFGFSLTDVQNAISGENVNIPGGDVTAGGSSYLVRVPGDFQSADEILNVPVKRKGDRPVYVRDLANLIDGYAPRSTYARMNGTAAVTVGVTKRAGANIVDIADEVKAMVAKDAKSWPQGVEYRVLADQSAQIRDMVSELENNIFTALILVVAVLLFALGARTSLFVAVAIPLSMLLSFVMIDLFGMTLNMVVLFSLILALGMLVDNGIVIVENIYRHAELGKSPFDASVDGTKEVALAVTASTATTVAAFLPLVFWTGIMGQFMSYLPKTVIIVLISSLVVALIVLPVSTALFMPKRRAGFEPPTRGPILAAYKRVLEWSINWRYLSAAVGFFTLVGTFAAYGQLNHGTEFFAETEPDRATVAVRAPDGTDLEATDRMVRQVEGILAQLENVDVYVAETGVSGTGDPMAGSQSAANQARITVDFLPNAANAKDGEKVRVEPSTVTIDTIRDAVALIPGSKITVEKERMGPPVGSPIAVEVAGDEFHQVGDLAQALRRELSKVEGATDLTDNYKVGRPEMTLRIDRGAAKRVGASTRDIATSVRTAVAGTKVSTLRDGEDEYDILVTVDPRYSSTMQEVLNLRIPGREDTSPDKFAVPLATVASFELTGGSGAIQHIDQDLVVTIQGDVAEGFNENTVRAAVVDQLNSWEGPLGYSVRLGGANDEQQGAIEFLSRAFLLAIFLIALVLVTQFNSFSRPGVVLASVVLSLVGVLWGLVITATPFGIMMTGIGVISLAGVVVNNAIVLLDYVEQLREQGMSMFDALVEAGVTRFRPVMLTAITTILGLVPMALGWSIDVRGLRFITGGSSAQFWGPMAVAVIFGLAFATLLTLVMVPTMYSIVEDLAWFRSGGPRRLFGRFRRPRPQELAGAAAVLALGLVGLWGGVAQAAPITLEDAFAAAMDRNIDVKLSAEQTEQSRATRGRALASLSPTVSASAAYVINEREVTLDPSEFMPETDTSGLEDGLSFLPEEQRQSLIDGFGSMFDTGDQKPTVISQKQFFTAGFTIRQTLFSGSALPGFLSASRSVDAAMLDEVRVHQQIKLQAAAAFFNLGVARKTVELAAANLELTQTQLADATRRVEAGLQASRAALQAQLAVASAERDLRRARAQEVEAEESFRRTTGLTPDSELAPTERLAVPPDLLTSLAAADDRPDREAAELRILAAKHQVTGWAFQWAPRVDAAFKFDYNPNSGFNDDVTPWSLTFSASWDLWDGGTRNARIRESLSQRRMAELQEEKLVQTIEEDVRITWERLSETEQSLDTLDTEVRMARENLRLAEGELSAGQANYLDVNSARISLMRSELALAQGEAMRQLRAVELLVATGEI
ncbi:MAG: efflux RND transporter permease subunit [Deltaproteobacteria bacterium]|nr:efflux RND transporter permease subunit [Deltaproteobacteria bacterium]